MDTEDIVFGVESARLAINGAQSFLTIDVPVRLCLADFVFAWHQVGEPIVSVGIGLHLADQFAVGIKQLNENVRDSLFPGVLNAIVVEVFVNGSVNRSQ